MQKHYDLFESEIMVDDDQCLDIYFILYNHNHGIYRENKQVKQMSLKNNISLNL